eukprot:CAMPEP_0194372598 /NCGR_PEP_ID=MMETSP0174-20130528/20987_1 /TAXON_ID=216777 /ORGANISM="Proboscia alata, Strain PI-D3" /LENGTH=948 /DNA_ID=CAMNT_0039151221 /DNA_START=45 /DNA_END=2891 /DNA_ORIENTATION=-
MPPTFQSTTITLPTKPSPGYTLSLKENYVSSTSLSTSSGGPIKLSQLQNQCKRDPVGYREDYDAQSRRLLSEIQILKLSPSTSPSPRLVELIQFVAAVSSSCYKGVESERIADTFMSLLGSRSAASEGQNGGGSMATSANVQLLHKDVRKACVSALILMRNKGAIPPLALLELSFSLMATLPDKHLRELLFHHIVNDVTNLNKKCKNEKVNRSIQSFLHKIVSSSANSGGNGEESESDVAAKRGVEVITHLYRKSIWVDSRTVSILASAALHPSPSVYTKVLRFFLQIEEKMEYDRQVQINGEYEQTSARVNLHLYSRKTRSRKRVVKKDLKTKAKGQRDKESGLLGEEPAHILRQDKGVEAAKKLYPAIELLNDPQGVAEAVLARLKKSQTIKFELKLLMLNFCTRLVGNQQLMVLPLYPYLQRYLGGGHQRDVTSVLCYAVQACHAALPPEELFGLLKVIATNFITERCSGETMAVGINAVRSICARVPSIMSVTTSNAEIDSKSRTAGDASTSSSTIDMEAFARDLVGYIKHRDRSVCIAARGWLNFVREVHPSLLPSKDRGSKGSALHKSNKDNVPLQYGELDVDVGVRGAELLMEYESKKKYWKERREELAEMLGDDDSDDEDGWQDVEKKVGSAAQKRKAAAISKENDAPGSDCEDQDAWEEIEEDAKTADGSDNDDNSGEEWIDVEQDQESEASEVVDSDKNKADKIDSNEEDDDVAPTLMNLDKIVESKAVDDNKNVQDKKMIDLSTMTKKECQALQTETSANRVFTTSDFHRMKLLVAKQDKLRSDPRAASKRKHDIAKGINFWLLSDDDWDTDDEKESEIIDGKGVGGNDSDSDDEGVTTTGAVTAYDIMALAKKKRQDKTERLEAVIAGREKFSSKLRAGGSTNMEKSRKKNFQMQKFSHQSRIKISQKETRRQLVAAGKGDKNLSKHDQKKRRRKL